MTPFSDVLVVPFSDLMDNPRGGHFHRGGPVWPDWERQTWARHRHFNGQLADVEPEAQEAVGQVSEPTVWIGPLTRHFGHQIADFSSRIVSSVDAWPDAQMLCATHPRFGFDTCEQMPEFIWDLMRWFGVNPARLRLLDRPIRFSQLFVAPQAEQRGGPGPEAAYLDRLDEIAWRNGLRSGGGSGAPLFVSRVSQFGKFAGETYLERALFCAGASVIRPETLPLLNQMHAYWNAGRLIFSEGSAMHGLQLLGRLQKPVDVLVRRPGSKVAMGALQPRTSALTYHEITSVVVHGLRPNGLPAPEIGISIPDEARIAAAFEAMDLPILKGWSSGEFQAAVERDLSVWLKREQKSPRASIKGNLDHIRTTLTEAGYPDIWSLSDTDGQSQ